MSISFGLVADFTMHEGSPADGYKPDSASPRSFGLLLGAILAVVALLPLVAGKPPVKWAGGAAALLFAVAIWAPVLLAGPTRAWLAFGGLLSRVVAPVALAVVFYGVFAVYGGLLRLMGRDAMKRKYDPRASTYWIERLPSEAVRTHFNNPF